MRTLPLLLLATGCTGLPEGWQGARPVDGLVQSDCTGADPYSGTPTTFAWNATGGALTVETVDPLVLRCEQAVEGWWKADGDTVSVLLQPTVMRPRAVAGCDCAYDLTVTIDGAEPTAVRLWERTDAYAGPPTLAEIDAAASR